MRIADLEKVARRHRLWKPLFVSLMEFGTSHVGQIAVPARIGAAGDPAGGVWHDRQALPVADHLVAHEGRGPRGLVLDAGHLVAHPRIGVDA